MSARKVGGIWFLKLGRLRLSFCRARSSAARRTRRTIILPPIVCGAE